MRAFPFMRRAHQIISSRSSRRPLNTIYSSCKTHGRRYHCLQQPPRPSLPLTTIKQRQRLSSSSSITCLHVTHLHNSTPLLHIPLPLNARYVRWRCSAYLYYGRCADILLGTSRGYFTFHVMLQWSRRAGAANDELCEMAEQRDGALRD